jgi:ADP-heptose:LPS heptosyltransferase
MSLSTRHDADMRRGPDFPDYTGDYFTVFSSYANDGPDTPRYLVTFDKGIGDGVAIGLSAVEQIVENDAGAYGAIDVLCNEVQSEIFRYDPRINRIIQTPLTFYPSPEATSWLKLLRPEAKAAELMRFLRGRRYEALFPGTVAPALFYRLGAHIMYPHIPHLVYDLFIAGKRSDKPMRALVRTMVNRYFGCTVPETFVRDDVTLYLADEHLLRGSRALYALRAHPARANCKVLLVAPDSASPATRPPTALLACALGELLRPGLFVCILPSYTDEMASWRLFQALSARDPERVCCLPAHPRLGLLETAALLDQADLLVTGDTGVMHLAVARKKIAQGGPGIALLKNDPRVVALFGGTNPGFYGYPSRSVILGRGRKEQRAFRPGFAKEGYDPGGRDLFDHISPRELSETVAQLLTN